MRLDIGDSIKTARRSQADISLDTKSNNFVRIQEQTLVIIDSTYPGQINKFDLSEGKIYAKIEKIRAGITFEVSTPSSVAGVRGTSWSVEADKEKDEIAVYEDSVFVKAFDKMKKLISEITIPQGFKTIIKRFESPGPLLPLTEDDKRQWKEVKKKVSKKRLSIEDLNNRIRTLVTKREVKQYRSEVGEEFVKIRREMATKKELSNLAQTVEKIAVRLVNLENQSRRIGENMVTKEDHNKVMKFLDKILKNIETLNQERVITNEQSRRLEVDVEQLKIKVGI